MSGDLDANELAVEWTGAHGNVYGSALNWRDPRITDDPKTSWDERMRVPDSDDNVLIRGGTIDLGFTQRTSKSMQISGSVNFTNGGSDRGLWTSLTVGAGASVKLAGDLDGGDSTLLVQGGATLNVVGDVWAARATFEANSTVIVSGTVKTGVAAVVSRAREFKAGALNGKGLTLTQGVARTPPATSWTVWRA